MCHCKKGIPQPQKRRQTEEDRYEHLNPGKQMFYEMLTHWICEKLSAEVCMFIEAGTNSNKAHVARNTVLACLIECRLCCE